MAALLGALPLALGRGIGSELRRPLGITIIGGLIVSQLLTLYTTPVVYIYLDRLRLWWERSGHRVASEPADLISRLTLLLQDAPHRSAEDVGLGLGRNAARIEHLLVALKLPVELFDFAAEDVGTEHDLLKCADVGFRRVRTHDAGPPEDRFERSGSFPEA